MDSQTTVGGAGRLLSSRPRRLLRNHQNLMFWIQIGADIATAVITLFTLTYLKIGEFPDHYRFFAIITILTIFGIYTSRGVYRQSANFWRTAMRVSLAWGLCIAFWLLLAFATKTSDLFSRQVILTWMPLVFVLQLLNLRILSSLNSYYKRQHARPIPALVVGDGKVARHLVRSLNGNSWLRDRVVGVVRSDDELYEDRAEAFTVPVLGNVSALRTLIRENGVRRIYMALPMSESQQIEGLHIDLLDMNVDVIWAPDIFAMNLLNHSVREVAGVPLISLNESPLTSSRMAMLLKSLMDKSCALLGLIVLSPLFLVIALLIKRSSKGPVFFKQDRTGFDGKVFKVYKFRSMKMHADDTVVKQATKEDPRVTAIGKFIRRTSIDELPQLINVLDGSMSLVGPRPHAVSHNDYYSGKINAYLARHRIKPGITGLAQISGYRGETETLDKMEKRVEYDLAYINSWSLGLDIKILLKTPASLFAKDIY